MKRAVSNIFKNELTPKERKDLNSHNMQQLALKIEIENMVSKVDDLSSSSNNSEKPKYETFGRK